MPIINLSYGFDPKELEKFESDPKLVVELKKYKVKLLVGVMSLAAGVIFGPGALTVGIALKHQKVVPT